jgi:hypothetical protein
LLLGLGEAAGQAPLNLTSDKESASVPASSNLNAAGLTMDVKAGFDSFYKEFAWLPIQITLALPAGQSNFQGRVEATFATFGDPNTVYQRNVQLIPPARKTVWLYLKGPRLARQVQIRLVADNGTEVIAPIAKSISPLSEDNLLLGVVSDDTSALNYLNNEEVGSAPPVYSPFSFGYYYYGGNRSSTTNVTPRVSVAHLSLSDLPPAGMGWDSLDGLVFADLNTTSGGEQDSLRTAAASWLAQGGALMVAGDSALRHASFLRNFLPVQSGETVPPPRTVSFNQLGALQKFTQSTSPLPSGNITVADTPLSPGSQSLLDQDGKSLLSTRSFGLGRSWFFGPEIRPLRSWDGMTAFWKTVLKDYWPRDNYTTSARKSFDGGYQWSFRLTPSPQVPELPTPWLLGLFLLVYVIMVGPVNYLLLRRIERRELAWITVPVLTVIFTAGCYAVGNFSINTDLVMSRLSIVTLGEGSDGNLSGGTNGLTGIYSNGRVNFNLKVAEEALSFPVFNGETNRLGYSTSATQGQNVPQTILQGPDGGYGRINMGIRAQRNYAFESDTPGNDGIHAHLKLVNGNLEGTIENTSGKDWDDISLIQPGGKVVQKIQNLKAGEKRQIKATDRVNNQSNLVQTITGFTNFIRNSGPNSANYTNAPYIPNNSQSRPADLVTQKAMALETYFGPNGEALPTDSGRFYLTAWRKQAAVPMTIQEHASQNYDLTLLFESLNLEQ